MSPELIAAVRERVAHGNTDESIREELLAAGYDESAINDVIAEARSGQSTPIPTPGAGAREPGVFAMIQSGMSFVQQRWDLVLLGIVPLVAIILLSTLWEMIAIDALAVRVVAALSIVVAIIGYLVVEVAIFYISVAEHPTSATIQDGLSWAAHNVLRIWWVYILVGLVVYGGALLFIVPGIIVSIATFLSPYAFIKEGKRGMAALLRSRDLIRGRWWIVFGKLLGAAICLLLVLMVLEGVLAGVSWMFDNTSAAEAVLSILIQAAGLVISIVLFRVGLQLYQWLSVLVPITQTPPVGAWKYRTLASLGLVVVGILVAGSVFLFNNVDWANIPADEVVSPDFPNTHMRDELQFDVVDETTG